MEEIQRYFCEVELQHLNKSSRVSQNVLELPKVLVMQKYDLCDWFVIENNNNIIVVSLL